MEELRRKSIGFANRLSHKERPNRRLQPLDPGRDCRLGQNDRRQSVDDLAAELRASLRMLVAGMKLRQGIPDQLIGGPLQGKIHHLVELRQPDFRGRDVGRRRDDGASGGEGTCGRV